MAKVTSMNEQQIQAVEARNSHILVSAPAGSGKTKILVTRILSILKEGIDIDSFLVLTFTSAAAKEMKQRLSGMLDEEIEKAEGKLKEHLLAQKEKMPFAYIMNFHGFCNSLIQHYGYLLGVQPGYDILSDSKPVLDKALKEAIDALLSDDDFSKMRYTYFGQREELEKEVLHIYEILQAVGDKEQFISYMFDDVYGFLENQGDKDLSEWCFYPQLLSQLSQVLSQVLVEIEELKLYCIEHDLEAFYNRPLGQKGKALEKPTPYDALHDYYNELYQRVNENRAFRGSGGIHEWAIQKPSASYNMPWKDYGDDIEDIKKEYNSRKTNLNSRFKKVYEQLIDTDYENTMMVHKESKSVIQQLLRAVFLTEDKYSVLKRKQGVLDFNDLEKYTTQLLQKEFSIASMLNEKLYEIMVDEYQDTNMVQETIVTLISKATNKEVPCFMVGDMKQSIYRFRQADPEIFKQKFDTYPVSQGAMRIDLGFNYRSSKVVLDSINFIFNHIMDSHIGSLEYYKDPSAQLNYDFLRKEGAKDTNEYEIVKKNAIERFSKLKDDATEVLMVNTSSEKPKDIEDGEYEAWMIGQRILEIKNQGIDGKAVSYSDFAVLMRQTTRFMTFKKVFDKLNIPTTIVLSNGFMQATEIRQMVMMLRCLENPYDDLALMSVLKAPFKFSHFKENEIAKIRDSKYSLYDNVCANETYASFIQVLEELKALYKQLPLSRWVQVFFEVSGYLKQTASMKNGIQRYQNLLLFVQKVKEVEGDIHDLKSWIDYFEALKESDCPPSAMPKDQDAVVFMTIHKSKGLEFPICFVAMHDKKFNFQDSKERLIFDRHLTMAIKPRLLKNFSTTLYDQPITYQNVIVEYANPFLALLARLANKETMSEEMRIYYVALTRAKNKLILTGCLDEETLKSYEDSLMVNKAGQVPEKHEWIFNRKMRVASCYMDWLMPCVIAYNRKYNQPLDNTQEAKFVFKHYNYNDIHTDSLETNQSNKNASIDLLFNVDDYKYSRELKSSIAVTTLEKEAVTNQYIASQKKEAQKMSATEKGTLVHEFMEYVPLEKNVSIKQVIDILYQQQRYTELEYEVLCEYQDKLETFIQSSAFEMMKNAKECLREQPFSFMKDGQLIHGTFDVLCIEDNQISIIDYKTDRVSMYSKNTELVEKHAFQLNLYKEALQSIYPDLKIDGYLYYLEIGRFVRV